MSKSIQIAPFAKKLAGLGAALALAMGNANGAKHPLTKINYDAAKNVNVVDVVMSIDWDFDAPPAGRDKSFIEAVLRQASQSLYTMTEGRQMLGKVYVYKNSQFMDNTDIRYLQGYGGANASVAGIGNCKSCRILMFAGTGETPDAHGKTIAHEFGHYMLGVFDEYRDEGSEATDADSPQAGDTPRDTIMNNQLQFVTLSTPTDYADPANRKTAQFRAFGKSAWEVLTSSPATDVNVEPGRIWFDPFKNMTAPTSAQLTKPTIGWESAFQMVWMGSNDAQPPTSGGPINVIVIDTTLGKSVLDAQINAAQQVINAAGDNNRVAVFAYPFSNAPVVPLTALSSADARSSVKDAIARIAVDSASDDTTVGDRLFDWAEATLPDLFPAGPKSASGFGGYYYRLYSTNQGVGVKDGEVWYFDGKGLSSLGPTGQWLPQSRRNLSDTLQNALNAIEKVRSDADTPMVTLFTTDTQSVSSDIAKAFQDAKVAVNPVVLAVSKGTPAGRRRFTATTLNSQSLYDLSKGTKGLFQEANKVAELSRDATKAANNAEGDNFELIAESLAENLSAGGTASLGALIAGSGIDGDVTFQTYWADEDDGKVSFTLTSPAGIQIAPTSLPNGITYTQNKGEGTAYYTVKSSYAGAPGKWTSTVTANKDTVDAVFQEVAVKSSLAAWVGIFGGTRDDPRAMTAVVEVSGPLPVKGANIAADIYSAADGKLVKSGLVPKDDGIAPDIKQNNGRYTVNIADLPVGDYEIVAKISGDGSAVFTTKGVTRKGANQPDVAIPPFQRSAAESFKKEL